MKLTEQFCPTCLDEVVGQPTVVQRLKAFLLEPYPCWFALTGPTGTGKSATAKVLCKALADQSWFGGSVYRESGATFDADAVKHYFGKDSPFRYRTAPNTFGVLRIEELERLPPIAQNAMKDAYDYVQERGWRAVVIATSNNMKMEEALRDRFGDPLEFSNGPEFAEAFCRWMKTVWMLESEEPIPAEYPTWGFGTMVGSRGGERSTRCRRAWLLLRAERRCQHEKRASSLGRTY